MPEETAELELEPPMAEPEEDFEADPGLGLGRFGLQGWGFREVSSFWGLGVRGLRAYGVAQACRASGDYRVLQCLASLKDS